jgi:hypothetical protein
MAVPSAQGGYYVSMNVNRFVMGATNKPIPLLSFVDANGTPKWTQKLTTGGYDSFFVSELKDGRLLLQGTTQATQMSMPNAVWAVYNVNRTTGQLTPVFRNVYKNNDYAQLTLTQDAQGNLWAQGSMTHSGNADAVLAKINLSTGAPEWSSVLNYALDDTIAGFIPKGGQFVLATNAGTMTGQNLTLGLLDNQGVPVTGSFKKYGDGNDFNYGQGLKAISGGNYLLYGTIRHDGGMNPTTGMLQSTTTAFIAKFDANLKLLWSKQYNAANNASFNVSEVSENKDSSLTLSGLASLPFAMGMTAMPTPQSLIVRLSATGDLQAGKRFESDSYAAGFFRNPDGSYTLNSSMMGGGLSGLGLSGDMLYGKLNSQFAPVWFKTLQGVYGFVTPTTSNSYVLTGSSRSWGAGNSDVVLGTLDNNGAIGGCGQIKTASLKPVALAVSVKKLNWTAQAATLAKRDTIHPASLSKLSVSTNATISTTPLCSD